MAKNEQFDESVSKWLEESAPARIPERLLDATFKRTRQSRQHVGWRALLGRLSMPKFLPALGSAAAIVVVAALALSLYANRQGGIGALPSPTPSPAPNSPSPSQSPSPTQVVDFPDLTKTFVSPRNGFSIYHPDEAAITPAEQLWGFIGQVDDWSDVVETGLAAVFKGASTNSGFGDGGSIDERVDQYLSEDRGNLPGGCGVPRSEQAEITIDGQSGRISECATRVEGTVVVGGRLYLFILEHDRSDARAVFDAFVATIDLTPETAVDFPGLTETFVSPTYGYSFGYMRGIIPATERWDPDDQPVEDIAHDPRFDAVETGLAAYLEGASTPIQDGISIDGWVDQYVTPLAAGGCGVPRSQQTEITIDGRPGRIAECANRLAGRSGANQVEATVVAGGRLYLFVLYRDSRDARAMFDAWVATIDLRPEDAAAPSSTPSS